MKHVEFAKEEKLADTMRCLYATTKTRQAVYTQQLVEAEAAVSAEPLAPATDGFPPQHDVQAPPPVVSCSVPCDVMSCALHVSGT